MRVVIRHLWYSICQGGRLGAALTALMFLFSIDAVSGDTFSVTNTADGGLGSLRWAMSSANANPGQDTINFQISGAAPFTINLLSALPAVTDPVTINATTQPGWATLGTPVVELNGAAAGSGSVGLQLNSFSNRVIGLAINRFVAQGIVLSGGGNIIQGNFIGTDTTGTLARGNGGFGIWVESSGNQIGGSKSLNRNVISGGNDTGIYVFNTSSNTIQGNYIGLDATGTNALGNNNSGIMINGGGQNLIGGAAIGAMNFISGNGISGVFVNGASAIQNVIQGNYIGTDISGESLVGNVNDGITVSGAPSNNITGNVISGNGTNGVYVAGLGAIGNSVAGNYIGTDAAGKLARGNHNAGVTISAGNGNLIGASNVISGNLRDGVFLTDGASGNVVQGNIIGLSAVGTNTLANGLNGISIAGASSNIIGGVVPTARNVISGNAYNGIGILTVTDVMNSIVGNYIGTDMAGAKSLPNTLAGVYVQGCSNTIGGATTGSGNVISGNRKEGIWLVGANGVAIGNIIQGNIIGLDAAGANIVSNYNAGIGISNAVANQIGGTISGARNVISGNGNSGVVLIGAGTVGNVLQGNYIGTDLSGNLARGNYLDGIVLQNVTSNQIGGPLSGSGNLISGNNANANTSGNNGIYMTGASWNTVQGNRIGTDASGTMSLGNSWDAIYMQNANSNQIGGAVVGAGNLLSANTREGIYLGDSSRNFIQGNFIGTMADGVGALGNLYHNIELDAGSTNNTIGGATPGAGNHIAFARTALYSGVRVRPGSLNNLITGNSIFSNAELGIDLGAYGVTPNVDCEAGQGVAANAGQNYPVLTNVYTGTATQIRGSLNSGKREDLPAAVLFKPFRQCTGLRGGAGFSGTDEPDSRVNMLVELHGVAAGFDSSGLGGHRVRDRSGQQHIRVFSMGLRGDGSQAFNELDQPGKPPNVFVLDQQRR